MPWWDCYILYTTKILFYSLDLGLKKMSDFGGADKVNASKHAIKVVIKQLYNGLQKNRKAKIIEYCFKK